MIANRKTQLEHIAEVTAHSALQTMTGSSTGPAVLVLDGNILSEAEREQVLSRLSERGLAPLVVLGPLELTEV